MCDEPPHIRQDVYDAAAEANARLGVVLLVMHALENGTGDENFQGWDQVAVREQIEHVRELLTASIKAEDKKNAAQKRP